MHNISAEAFHGAQPKGMLDASTVDLKSDVFLCECFHGYKLLFLCHRLNINFHDITINSICLFFLRRSSAAPFRFFVCESVDVRKRRWGGRLQTRRRKEHIPQRYAARRHSLTFRSVKIDRICVIECRHKQAFGGSLLIWLSSSLLGIVGEPTTSVCSIIYHLADVVKG